MTPEVLWTTREAREATGGRALGDWVATGVSIDSRSIEAGELFVALEGPHNNGHDHVAEALAKGAAAALVRRIPEGLSRAAPLLQVADTQAALEALGSHARGRVGARIAAITGSVGKTGTKQALDRALGRSGACHASLASYNNLWGVPLSLARMPRHSVYGVFEIGMNHAGEIVPLARQVRPQVAIVTAVTAAHLEFFAPMAEIAEAKAEVFQGLEPGGSAIINRDCEYFELLAGRAREHGARVLSFGQNDDADVRLERLALHATCSCASADIAGQPITYKIGLPGRHWALNSLAVLAAVKEMGADLGLAALALAELEAPAGRGRLHRVELDEGHFSLIDDSYNANPASVEAGLAVLGGAQVEAGGRRLAVLGDMRELGDGAIDLHAGLAATVEQNAIDLVFTCGPLMTHLAASLPASRLGSHADSAEEILPQVLAALRPGDVVLVKGSLASRMGLVAEALLAPRPRSRAARQAVNG